MKVKIGGFLRPENLNGATSKAPVTGNITAVRFIPAEELNFKSDEGRYELKIALNDDSYDWLANKSSLKVLIGLYGDESDNWVNKPVKLYSIEQNVGGEIKQIVYAIA